MKEIIKNIPGYEGYYKASNLGYILSYYGKEGKPEIMIGSINRGGYHVLGLTNKLGRKTVTSHSMICKTFKGNRPKNHAINHINGNKLDNNIDNLEYCTYSYNSKHRFEKLGHKGMFGKANGNYGNFGEKSATAKKVHQFTKEGQFIKTWNSLVDVQRTIGILQSSISSCLSGKYKSAGGFIWKS